jgi:hypothetical protein
VEWYLDTSDGPYVRYPGLTLIGQRLLANRAMLPVIETNLATQADEADLYLMLNTGGAAHTEADLDSAAQHASSM